jgi:lysophospholipase L1-like esterase
MHSNPACSPRGLRAAVVLALALLVPVVLAQPPAPSPNGVAPAVTTGTLNGFTLSQQTAAAGLMISMGELATAATNARTALNQAVFAEPFDRAALDAKAQALLAAEMALANARVAALARIQSTPDRFTPAQMGQLATQAGGRGGGVVPRHNGFMADKAAAQARGGPQFLLMGDSITDFWRDANRGAPAIFQKAFGQYTSYNIGISGIRTVDVLLQINLGLLDGISPKVAMLMIGTNDLAARGTPEGTAGSIKEIVAAVRQKLPSTKILLLGVFPRGNLASDPYREQIRQVNAIISKLDDGKQVRYLDFGEKFLKPDGTLPPEIMPDFLHPNAAGYQIWADAVSGVIQEMMR